MNKLGETIRYYRKTVMGKSQKWLADELYKDIDFVGKQGKISRIENGQNVLTLPELHKLQEIFQITDNELINIYERTERRSQYSDAFKEQCVVIPPKFIRKHKSYCNLLLAIEKLLEEDNDELLEKTTLDLYKYIHNYNLSKKKSKVNYNKKKDEISQSKIIEEKQNKIIGDKKFSKQLEFNINPSIAKKRTPIVEYR